MEATPDASPSPTTTPRSPSGQGALPVLGTPRLLAWCEAATCAAHRARRCRRASTSVGTRVELEHLAASPVGAAGRGDRLGVVRRRPAAPVHRRRPRTLGDRQGGRHRRDHPRGRRRRAVPRAASDAPPGCPRRLLPGRDRDHREGLSRFVQHAPGRRWGACRGGRPWARPAASAALARRRPRTTASVPTPERIAACTEHRAPHRRPVGGSIARWSEVGSALGDLDLDLAELDPDPLAQRRRGPTRCTTGRRSS